MKSYENLNSKVPNYLREYAKLWNKDPHAANLEWFKNAKMGMFIHYGLYSMLGMREWVQLDQKIPVSKYAKLKDNFTAHNFDVDFITDLALEAEMKYILMVTCHHDSFCLWNSRTEPFNSVNSPCGRDLVAEMAEACERKGLGFFTYYTFMLNWRHPYYLSREYYEYARPDYNEPQPEYLFRKKEDFSKYLDYVYKCIDELLKGYGNIAGMWFDIISLWYNLGHEFIPIEQIYNYIRKKQPHILIAWKQGATGTEDYASTEQCFNSLEDLARKQGGEEAAKRARIAWELNKNKHNEVNATTQKISWGFNAFCEHRTDEELYNLLEHALKNNCNLCLNIGPMGDGSIHPTQVKLLKKLGERIRKEGWPSSI